MKNSLKFLSMLMVVIFSGTQVASADMNVKVITSKTVSGDKEIIYVSGETETSPTYWSAKVPTKMKIYKDEINVIPFKFKPLVSYSDVENIRIEIVLWSKAGKKIDSARLYDWNPTGGTTIEDFSFYNRGKLKAGSYLWVITTTDYRYDGKGEIKVPVTIQY